jgi:signal transduction histidine kinase
MNGNVTKEGITADLEAMREIGVGGATIVNVDCGIPAGPVRFMSPEWREDVRFAVREAHRLGLQLGMANCAGWSSSGGPWITVTNAMQRLTSSEVLAHGPRAFEEALPQPQANRGYYRDIAVLAFPVPPSRTNSAGNSRESFRRVENLAFANGPTGLEVVHPPEKTAVDRTFVCPPPAVGEAWGETIARDGIVDLTDRLTPEGRLRWDVPPGDWTIIRFGYTPVGIENHPAPAEGTGLECDKLSKAALDAHWEGCMRKVLEDAGSLAGKSLGSSLLDSYEVGRQDWTETFREEFRKRRGYDPLRYLPAFTRRIVETPEVTGRFLWDMRRTVADLFAENYYGHFAELCRRHGLESEVEPYSGPFESLQCGGSASVVMGEFWAGTDGHPSVKLAASVAHAYGKSLVGAEAFTAGEQQGGWREDPGSLKPLGDLMFCQGVNRYYFHRYALQPWTNRWPGMTMGGYGINFERTQTWWAQGKVWIDYISRCQFLLQQGRAVADIAGFVGESAPSEMPAGTPLNIAGYDYDGINAEVLRQGAQVRNRRITLPGGASYAVLVLPPEGDAMTPQTLESLSRLVLDGAVLVGPPPRRSPSLAGYPECDRTVQRLVEELWGGSPGDSGDRRYGQGRLVWGRPLAEVLASLGLKPDFEYKGADGSARLVFTHRVADSNELYFVSNQRRVFETVDCTFRVSGKAPELWHPDTGVMEPAPLWSVENGRTRVRLNLEPAGSVFVVFRPSTNRFDPIVSSSESLVAFGPGEGKVEILHALYAAVDGAAAMDVTETMRAVAREKRWPLVAANQTMGRDPAENHAKQLIVDYTLNGRFHHVVVPEGETLMFPASSSSNQPPLWETSISGIGLPIVKLWSKGQVELRTEGGSSFRANGGNLPAPRDLSGGWKVAFPAGWGAPPSLQLERLASWTELADPGARYFSGTATYEKEVEIGGDLLQAGKEVWLDLGEVRNFAEVFLNDRSLGTLWKPPFRVNLTEAAKPGLNRLVIKVTNLWPNRLIGDEQLAADCEWSGARLARWPQWLLDGQPSPAGRYTFSTWRHYAKDSPPLPSGLLGPVRLQFAAVDLIAPSDTRSRNTSLGWLGSWIWDKQTFNGQTCQFWRSFEIPRGARVVNAAVAATADDEFTLYLDGQELGHGADWREVYEFDSLAPFLSPGKHVLAVRVLNSFHSAGMILGLHVELADGSLIELRSDPEWRLAPLRVKHFAERSEAQPDWPRAVILSPVGGAPWQPFPANINKMPALPPAEVFFWQRGWFQLTLAVVCGLVGLYCFRLMAQLALHRKEEWLLQRERARIAREIHDDIGARMTQLVLHGELVQDELPDNSEMRSRVDHLCEEARGLLATMDGILWAVNPRRDTLRDFVGYVCKYVEDYLKHTSIQLIFDVAPELTTTACNMPVRRSLLMGIKEALNNAVKHSQATELRLRIQWRDERLSVLVRDNGRGFDSTKPNLERNGLTNMAQRMSELGGSCAITSRPGEGCSVEFSIPLKQSRPGFWSLLTRSGRGGEPAAEPAKDRASES